MDINLYEQFKFFSRRTEAIDSNAVILLLEIVNIITISELLVEMLLCCYPCLPSVKLAFYLTIYICVPSRILYWNTSDGKI